MKIYVIGSGAMGSLYGGLLHRAGIDVTLVDIWREHVEAIDRNRLHLDGISGDLRLNLKAVVEPGETEVADVVFVQVNTYATRAAAETAKRVLRDSGYAVTFQNGAGNVETLCEVLDKARVVGGLSYHSAAVAGPGHVLHTHRGPTWLGELDGSTSPRVRALADALDRASLQPTIVDNIMSYIWTKFIHNSAINPICAALGLRVGEIPRTAGADELQTKIIEEALAVLKAKGIKLADPDPMKTIKEFCKAKFNKPSMLQHMEAGKETEIDSLNGTIARLGRELGIPTPYNEALTWIVKGMNAHRRLTMRGPPIDYEALEREAKAAGTEKS
jgi:2-dehydropantoate 2-reductase